jgi:hypothetical protein
MSPSEYFEIIVEPTLKEYFENQTDYRKCIISCIVIIHIHDYLKHAGYDVKSTTKSYFYNIANRCPEALDVYWVAIAGKHAVPDDKSIDIRPESLIERPPMVWGEAVFGLSRWDDEYGGLELRTQGQSKQFELELRRTLDFFRDEISKFSTIGISP